MKKIKLLLAVVMMLSATTTFAQFSTGRKTSSSNSYSGLTLNSGYKGFVDLGYGIGVGDYGVDRIEFTTVHGYQFIPYFYAGVGVGYSYYHEDEAHSIPIFADFRGSFPISNTKVAPFVDFKIGYSVCDVEGFYIAPSIGLRYALSEHAGLNFAIGYEAQKADFYWSYGGYYATSKESCGAFTIKIGIDF